MGEHLGVCADRLLTDGSSKSLQESEAPGSSGESSYSHAVDPSALVIDIKYEEEPDEAGEDEPLLQTVECRICQEEDSIKNLEAPCSCNGSLKYAHRKCVQSWCNEKGDITCEICRQPYQPGYTAPPARPEDVAIDISGGWTVDGNPMDLHDPRILAMAAAEHHFLDADYDEYADSSASGSAFCRSTALILLALLLLRQTLVIGNDDKDDDDISTFFSLFLLRAFGFLLPCYIMAWALSLLQQRRQRQEAATLAASEVAFMLQAAQAARERGLQVTIAPRSGPEMVPTRTQENAATPHPEPIQ
ncbi:ubiquitin-protein ligase [Lithospermum erythrorhizon]|uniref:Ubiquitin-protein ligase n=1 Tax=Lithospermum erythrorhizon TaxID=34254 RepID=A0AAV3PSP0_LITER